MAGMGNANNRLRISPRTDQRAEIRIVNPVTLGETESGLWPQVVLLVRFARATGELRDRGTGDFYSKETNNYARELTASKVSGYVRAGNLARIDYGQFDGQVYTTKPAGQVVLTTADRCTPGKRGSRPGQQPVAACLTTGMSCTRPSPEWNAFRAIVKRFKGF
jgi:hypothetical protein